MVRYTLEICLEPHDSRVYGNDKRWVAYQKEVLGTLRLLADQAWGMNIRCFVDAESPRAPELLAVIEDLRKRKVAKPLGQCVIAEQLSDDQQGRVEWFEITHWPLYGYTWVQPKPLLEYGPPPDAKKWPAVARVFAPVANFGLKTVYASRQQPGRHLAKGGMSEQVKALVEREGLSGLELLWLPDAGRAEAMQWYLPIPTEPLGRGLDHPWFDPASLNCEGCDPNRATDQPSAVSSF